MPGFDPDQPRDEKGQWTAGDAGSAIKTAASLYHPSQGLLFELPEPIKKPEAPVVHDEDEAEELLQKFIEEGIINDDHQAAVTSYTGSGYASINSTLRQGKELYYIEEKKTVEALDEFLKVAPKFAGETYRGIRFKNRDGYESFLNDVNDDSIIMDIAYGSTSLDESKADDFASGSYAPYKIKMVVSGSSGVYVDPISAQNGEKEVLYPRKTKFRVKSVSIEEGDGYSYSERANIYIEEIKE